MKYLRYGLAAAGLLSISTLAFAAGLFPDFPVVGGATYCAGSSQSAVGTIIGSVTGCPNQVPAGPTIVTGNEQIPADTRLGSAGAAPQTVLLGLGSLNALPITFQTITVTPASIVATNIQGGLFLSSSTTITAINLTLPPTPIDGQQYALSANRTITTLTVAAGGTASIGANTNPTVLTASTTAPQGYRFVYNLAGNIWFRLQ
jgi:hypothetical protein